MTRYFISLSNDIQKGPGSGPRNVPPRASGCHGATMASRVNTRLRRHHLTLPIAAWAHFRCTGSELPAMGAANTRHELYTYPKKAGVSAQKTRYRRRGREKRLTVPCRYQLIVHHDRSPLRGIASSLSSYYHTLMANDHRMTLHHALSLGDGDQAIADTG